MNFEIKHRYTDKTIFTVELDAKYKTEPYDIQRAWAAKFRKQKDA